MDNYPGKPGPKPGRIKETRAENERLVEENARLRAENTRVSGDNAVLAHKLEKLWLENERLLDTACKTTTLPASARSFAYPTMEDFAAEIFIRRAANLKLEGFPDDARWDTDAQRPVILFWEKLRDHCLFAAAAFYSEADPKRGEEIAEAPPENAHNSETDGPRHDHD